MLKSVCYKIRIYEQKRRKNLEDNRMFQVELIVVGIIVYAPQTNKRYVTNKQSMRTQKDTMGTSSLQRWKVWTAVRKTDVILVSLYKAVSGTG